MNDVTIIGGLAFMFVMLGIMMPFVNSEFDTEYQEIDNIDELAELQNQDDGCSWELVQIGTVWTVACTPENNNVSLGDVVASIIGMATWSFGILPSWFDFLLIPLRIVFWFTLLRNIWIGGGA